MARKPKFLVPPCGRSKQERIEWMQGLSPRPRGGRNYRHGGTEGPWLFYWDVRLHGLDLGFQNLLDIAVGAAYVDPENKGAVNYALEKYGNTDIHLLQQHAVNDACREFCNEKGIPENHANTSLWSGDDVGAEYSFMGSGGGWLVMTEIMGYTLDTELFLEGMTYRQVRAVSEMVWYVTKTISNRGPERAVETCAAWILFRDFE